MFQAQKYIISKEIKHLIYSGWGNLIQFFFHLLYNFKMIPKTGLND